MAHRRPPPSDSDLLDACYLCKSHGEINVSKLAGRQGFCYIAAVMSIKFGYARVSTHDQTHDLQLDALAAAGCAPECIHTDTCSGSVACADRPALQQLRIRLRPGDTLVVWRLDRLGRNLQDLIGFVDGLRDDDVQFASLTEQMDTTTHMGRLIFQIFGALAEYERALLSERAATGAAAARARGRMGGRPRVLTPDKLSTAQALMRDPSIPVTQICRTVGVSRRTLYRHLAPDGTLRTGGAA